MANPAVLLIKPLIKAITKAAVKVAGSKTATAATAKVAGTAAKTGVGALAKGSLSATDAINIARAAVDKKLAPSIARSLGMTTKELNKITAGIRMTEARKQAVQGKNYVKNLNRFLTNPEKSVKSYVKNQLRKGVRKQLKPLTDKMQSELDEAAEKLMETPKLIALKQLEIKLKSAQPAYKFPKAIWDNVDDIDTDVIFEIMEQFEMDLYYTSKHGEVAFVNDEHKGYKRGILFKDYVADIEHRLLAEVVGTPIDGII